MCTACPHPRPLTLPCPSQECSQDRPIWGALAGLGRVPSCSLHRWGCLPAWLCLLKKHRVWPQWPLPDPSFYCPRAPAPLSCCWLSGGRALQPAVHPSNGTDTKLSRTGRPASLIGWAGGLPPAAWWTVLPRETGQAGCQNPHPPWLLLVHSSQSRFSVTRTGTRLPMEASH